MIPRKSFIDMLPLLKALRAHAQEKDIGEDITVSASCLFSRGTLGAVHFEAEPWHKGLDVISVDRHAKDRDPAHLWLTAVDPFLWVEHREALAAIVLEHGFSYVEGTSWDNTHHRTYQFFILDSTPREEPWVPVCLSHDPRAFQCVFKHVRAQGVDIRDASYRWTETGFVFCTSHKKYLEAVQQVYSNCTMVLKKAQRFWDLTVDFPQAG